METNKQFGAKTTPAAPKSVVEKVVRRRKKDPYEVPVKKMESHKSRFKPKKEKDVTPVVTAPEIAFNETPVVPAPEIAFNETPVVPAPEIAFNETPVVTAPEIESNESPVVTKTPVVANETPETSMDDSSSEDHPEIHEEPKDTSNSAAPEVETQTEEPDNVYTEYYANGYCRRDKLREEYYARDEMGSEYYWKDPAGAEVYASRTETIGDQNQKIEYPLMKDNTPYYIDDGKGKPRYPINLLTQMVVFPRDPDTGEEMYLTDIWGKTFYPENKFGKQSYRKDLEGNEVAIDSVYAKHEDGSEFYPMKANGDQYYLMQDSVEVPAVKRKENKRISYYAKRANGDEIYPRMYLEEEDYVEQ